MATATVIPISGSLAAIQEHIDALFESLEGLEDAAQREECEADIYRYIAAEIAKVDSIAGYIAFCEAQQKFAAEEVKRLQDRKKSFERKQERLEGYVQRLMEAGAKTKLEGRTSTLLLKKCPPAVDVIDQSLVPQEYIRVKVEESVDKTAAKQAMQAGAELPGLKLTTRVTVVRK